jgi:hypothetical protein
VWSELVIHAYELPRQSPLGIKDLGSKVIVIHAYELPQSRIRTPAKIDHLSRKPLKRKDFSRI